MHTGIEELIYCTGEKKSCVKGDVVGLMTAEQTAFSDQRQGNNNEAERNTYEVWV